jgi:membrane protein DedA with SNARE-associated domain
MFEGLVGSVNGLAETLGPLGIFLAMFIETVFPPIPSELVMPVGGYIAYTSGSGIPGLAVMILAGTAGSTLGAVLIYFIARLGGREAVLRYGKRFFLDEKNLRRVEEWFDRHGFHAVFLCRMAPGLRELISIPAGLAKMNIVRFLVPTFLGSLVWSAFLGSIGYFLIDAWKNFNAGSVFNVVAMVLVLFVVIYLVMRHFKRSSKPSRPRKRRASSAA